MQLDDKALQFEITDDERRELQDLMRMPGYRVQQKIMDSYVQALRDGATAVSMADPFGERDKVCSAWAYAKIGNIVRTAFEAGMKFEIDVLKMRTAKQVNPEKIAEMRRRQFTLEAIPTEVNANGI